MTTTELVQKPHAQESMSAVQEAQLTLSRLEFLMKEVKETIPKLEEISRASNEARELTRQKLLQAGMAFKGAKYIKPELVDAFLTEPYSIGIEPVKGRRDAFYLHVPRFYDHPFGFLVRQTKGWNIFIVTRIMDFFGELPEEVREQLGFKKTAPLELRLQGTVLMGPKKDLEEAWKRYKPQLKFARNEEDGIHINPRYTFDLLASLVDDGILPFTPHPVAPSDRVERLFTYSWEDPETGETITKTGDSVLRPYQREAWKKLCEYGHVGVYFPASTGKTVQTMHATTQLKPPHLVVVPTKILAEQWIQRIQEHTDLKVGEEVFVVTYQSATRHYLDREWTLLAVDEVHHLPANEFSRLALIKRKYTLGLSASPFREDGRENYIIAFSGWPIGLSWNYFRDMNLIKSPVCNVWLLKDFNSKLRKLDSMISEKKKTIIFSDHIDLGKTIASRFKIPFIHGGTKENRFKILEENPVVVASRVADEGISLPEIEQTIEMDWLGGCYDDQTQILTELGWRKFSEVTGRDRIATLGANREVSYHEPIDVQKYWYTGEMVHFKGRSYDLLVTPNHEMYVGRRGKFKFQRASVLAEQPVSALCHKELLRAAIWKGSDVVSVRLPDLEPTDWIAQRASLRGQALALVQQGLPTQEAADNLGLSYWTVHNWRKGTDPKRNQWRAVPTGEVPINSWLELLAWYISEGSVDHDRSVKIAQTDQLHKEEIKDIVHRAGFVPHVREDAVRIHSAQLARYFKNLGVSQNKFIPRPILDLPPARLRLFLRTLLKGDGSENRKYFTSSQQLANDVQELAFRCGYAATLTQSPLRTTFGKIRGREIRSQFPQYVINISYKQLSPQIWKKPTRPNYQGYVYDVTVPNHIIMVRRNGRAVWCSNSRRQSLQRFTRLLHGFASKTPGEHHILMTAWEYERDKKRLFSVMDKGFKVEIHREGVSEKRLERIITSSSRTRTNHVVRSPVPSARREQNGIPGLRVEIPETLRARLPYIDKTIAKLPGKLLQQVAVAILANPQNEYDVDRLAVATSNEPSNIVKNASMKLLIDRRLIQRIGVGKYQAVV